MKKVPTPFPDVWLIHPDVFEDSRGFFFESYSYRKFLDIGLDAHFLQDNHSKSARNTVRGLHFQLPPGQIKLIRCSLGAIWDIIVDIRPDSSTFKKWWGVELNQSNFLQIWIPVGYAHGYSVISDVAEVQYKVSNYYDPSIERGFAWNDLTIAVDWKINSPILSKRDKENPPLDSFLANNPSFHNTIPSK